MPKLFYQVATGFFFFFLGVVIISGVGGLPHQM
jgi:hypothetical protein